MNFFTGESLLQCKQRCLEACRSPQAAKQKTREAGLTKEVVVNFLVAGLPGSSTLVHSQSLPYLGLCQVVIKAAEVCMR